jgi:hypothetical protein
VYAVDSFPIIVFYLLQYKTKKQLNILHVQPRLSLQLRLADLTSVCIYIIDGSSSLLVGNVKGLCYADPKRLDL